MPALSCSAPPAPPGFTLQSLSELSVLADTTSVGDRNLMYETALSCPLITDSGPRVKRKSKM